MFCSKYLGFLTCENHDVFTRMDIELGLPQRLGHLPLVMDVFRRSRMDTVIDHAVKEDPRSDVSTAECVAVILSGVFVGAHSLWRLRERLEPYDMQTVMRDNTFDLQRFPEERLAKCLDDLYRADPDRMMTAIATQAIAAHKIDTTFLHFDTTSLSFYGGYEREDPFASLPDVITPPRVTFGYSKAHRGDLKQIIYGMLVSNDGGVPLLGKALDGNASDTQAAVEFFGKVRDLVEDPRSVCCVADCKGWAPTTLTTITEAGMRLLSRLPRNKRLHADIMGMRAATTGVLEVPARGKNKDPDLYEYAGFDVVDQFAWQEEQGDGTKKRRVLEVPARAVRVQSPALLRTKRHTLDRLRKQEEIKSRTAICDWQHHVYACETDARRAADRHVSQAPWATLTLTATVNHHRGPVKRGRGRPRKIAEPALAKGEHWRVTYATNQASEEHITAKLIEQSTFVLIRTRTEGWDISDEEMIRRYKQQYRVEHGFAWLKSTADVNPAFLHTPHRIAALCFIYCMGLMIWNITQRTVRKNLNAWGTGLPYHRNKPSSNITTRFLYELFPTVVTQTIRIGTTPPEKRLLGLTPVHDLACRALGTTAGIFSPCE